jgi:hypothetical protein
MEFSARHAQNAPGDHILAGVGSAQRKSQAEQNCAKAALLNLGIPLNF